MTTEWKPVFGERWRHGGWYITNLRYPSGAAGCVSNNYADGRWRIVCDPRSFEDQPSFGTRTEAALAEYKLVREARMREMADRWRELDSEARQARHEALLDGDWGPADRLRDEANRAREVWETYAAAGMAGKLVA